MYGWAQQKFLGIRQAAVDKACDALSSAAGLDKVYTCIVTAARLAAHTFALGNSLLAIMQVDALQMKSHMLTFADEAGWYPATSPGTYTLRHHHCASRIQCLWKNRSLQASTTLQQARAVQVHLLQKVNWHCQNI